MHILIVNDSGEAIWNLGIFLLLLRSLHATPYVGNFQNPLVNSAPHLQ